MTARRYAAMVGGSSIEQVSREIAPLPRQLFHPVWRDLDPFPTRRDLVVLLRTPRTKTSLFRSGPGGVGFCAGAHATGSARAVVSPTLDDARRGAEVSTLRAGASDGEGRAGSVSAPVQGSRLGCGGRDGRPLSRRRRGARSSGGRQAACDAVRRRRGGASALPAGGARRGAAVRRPEHGHDLRRRRVAGKAVHRHGVSRRRDARTGSPRRRTATCTGTPVARAGGALTRRAHMHSASSTGT